MTATDILVVSGGGRYADPWHPFAETSAALAEVLGELGTVAVLDDPDAALAALAEVADRPRLLVVNVGNPVGDSPSDAARAGLGAYLAARGSVLAVHSSATTFVGWPEWESALGGRWVRGTTFHPPLGTGAVDVVAGHPATAGVAARFEVDDEFYRELRIAPTVSVLATHEIDGVPSPTAWASTTASGGRVVCDLLGHDARSYRSEGRRRLLLAEARWALG